MASYETFTAQKLFLAHEQPEPVFEGAKWNEGPVWLPASQTLIWSDIPNDRLMRFDALSGRACVFRQGSNNANGNALDREGRLVTCEHATRRVSRTGHDGSVSVLADRHDGRRLNSPNDVVVKRDGSIWFSDPTYGIDSDYFGSRGRSEQPGSHLYRLDPASGALSAVVTDMVQPNGLAFSPDESVLYVVDSGRTGGAEHPAHIRRFRVGADGGLEAGGVLADCPAGVFDGIRVDSGGNVWAGAGDGVYCFGADGEPLGRIVMDEPVINLCFGGRKLNELYMCAPTRVWRAPVRVSGVNPWGAA